MKEMPPADPEAAAAAVWKRTAPRAISPLHPREEPFAATPFSERGSPGFQSAEKRLSPKKRFRPGHLLRSFRELVAPSGIQPTGKTQEVSVRSFLRSARYRGIAASTENNRIARATPRPLRG